MNEADLENYRKSGRIAAEAVRWSRALIKPGAQVLDTAREIEQKIQQLGGDLAFPVNIGINDITAHYTPHHNDTTIIKCDDVVKVDLGAMVDGYISDTAYTIDLGGNYSDMLRVNNEALDNAIDIIKDGVKLSEIGKTVEETIKSEGFKVIENLTGHQIEQFNLHAGLSIPNTEISHDARLEEGMVVAVEPFATCGAGRVIDSNFVEIYSVIRSGRVRSKDARVLLKELEKRHGMPFASRWYLNGLSHVKMQAILRELLNSGILRSYPMLHEKGAGVVSQFEHTIIVEKDGCEVTTLL